MEKKLPPTFGDDQYFILKKDTFGGSLNEIEKIVMADQGDNEPFEKEWIPENQVNGTIQKIDRDSFDEIDERFKKFFKEPFENHTNLKGLELVAVRRNILKVDDFVSMHRDFGGYVVMVDIPRSPKPAFEDPNPADDSTAPAFEGGNILFKKDNGEIVEIKLEEDEIFVAKCTNEHGVTPVVSGKRESIALFSRPKLK